MGLDRYDIIKYSRFSDVTQFLQSALRHFALGSYIHSIIRLSFFNYHRSSHRFRFVMHCCKPFTQHASAKFKFFLDFSHVSDTCNALPATFIFPIFFLSRSPWKRGIEISLYWARLLLLLLVHSEYVLVVLFSDNALLSGMVHFLYLPVWTCNRSDCLCA